MPALYPVPQSGKRDAQSVIAPGRLPRYHKLSELTVDVTPTRPPFDFDPTAE
jgi:hypothetical protein